MQAKKSFTAYSGPYVDFKNILYDRHVHLFAIYYLINRVDKISEKPLSITIQQHLNVQPTKWP